MFSKVSDLYCSNYKSPDLRETISKRKSGDLQLDPPWVGVACKRKRTIT